MLEDGFYPALLEEGFVYPALLEMGLYPALLKMELLPSVFAGDGIITQLSWGRDFIPSVAGGHTVEVSVCFPSFAGESAFN